MMSQSDPGFDPRGGGQQSQENWLSAPPPAATVEQHEAELFSAYCTLDEPVMETIMRDVNAVWAKLKIVLLPMDRPAFTFPIQYMSVSTAATAESAEDPQPPPQGSPTNNNGVPAAAVAANASNNFELSENDRKVIQSLKDWDLWGPLVLCLGLAVLLSFKAPTDQASLVFAAVFCSVWAGGSVVTINAQLLGGTISFFQSLCVIGYSMFPLVISSFIIGCFKMFIKTWMWFDLIFIFVGFVWSVRVSAVFLGLYIKPERRFLALYPVFFFYTFLSWMILVF